MRIRSVAMISLGLALFGRAEESWYWQHPLPSSLIYNAVHMLDAETGFLGACCGNIFRTSDGGGLWAPTPTGRKDLSIRSFSFPHRDTGYASADSGYVFKTTDGGRNWTSQRTASVREALYDIQFLDTRSGFAVGSLGMIAKTFDGGATWDTTYPAGLASFTSVEFPSRDIGYAGGSNALVLKTVDGGTTWSPRQVPNAKHIYDLKFRHPDTGMAVGDSGAVLFTNDGGATWTRRRVGGLSTISLAYADSGFVFAVVWGGEYPLYRSRDGGLTWQGQHERHGPTLYSVQFSGGKSGFAVGPQGKILKTTDLGNTWSDQGSLEYGPRLQAVFFPTPYVGIAVGESGALARTVDAGRNWAFSRISSFPNMHAVTFVDSSVGFIVGDTGTAFRSDDAGANWRSLETGSRMPLRGLHFNGPLRGVALGGTRTGFAGSITSTGGILRTLDGGATWDSLPMPGIPALNAIHFPREPIGYACGDSGAVFRSLDGGANWTRLPPAGTQSLLGIRFLNDSTGVAVGGNAVLRTEDSGATWTGFTGDTTSRWLSISSAGGDTLWVTGQIGRALRSVDGGKTWTDQTFPGWVDLQGSHFRNGRNGYVVGTYGSILRWGAKELPPIPVSIGSAKPAPIRQLHRASPLLKGYDARGRDLGKGR